MKKKIFTLLTLLLCVCSGAWADEILFSYTIPSTAANPASEGWDDNEASGTIGGTCSFYYKSSKGYYADGNNGKVYKLDGGDASVKVTLAGTNKFNVGDKVIVNFSGNSGSDDRNFVVKNAYKGKDASNISSPSHKNSYTEETVILSSAFSTLNVLYIERSGGMSISSVRVVRPSADTESPTCTTAQTSETTQAGVAKNLTVTATHYVSLQWYKASDSELSDAAPVTGATNATYAYTPEDADVGNTYYFYCIATNNNATADKTAQSSTISVTVTAAQLALQTFTDNNATCTWNSFNVAVASGSTKSGNGLYFDAAANQIKMNSGQLQVVAGNIMYVQVPSATSSGKVTIIGGSTTDRYFETKSSNKVYVRASDNKPNTINFTSDDIATIDEVTYLKLTSMSDNKFDGVKIELNGGFVKTNAGKWTSFTPASTAVYNSGSAITKFSLPEGAQAYIITAVTNTTVTANRITVMNAGEGYFIKGESASTNYAVACTTTDADATTGNKVVACLVATTIDGSTPNTNSKFILGTNTANNEAGLFLVDSEITIPAGKAYLDAGEVIVNPSRSLNLNFDDNETTGINAIDVENTRTEVKDNVYYNLNGQRVANPSKGLFIVNGKKVIIK